jgi:hypothetical protein
MHQFGKAADVPLTAIHPPCIAPECKGEAVFFPVLQLYPRDGAYRGRPWEITLEAPLCKEHCLNDAEQYLNTQVWLSIIAAATKNGVNPPKRNKTRVRFVLITPEKDEEKN